MSDISILFEKSVRDGNSRLDLFLEEQSELLEQHEDRAAVITQLACVDLTVSWEKNGDEVTMAGDPGTSFGSSSMNVLPRVEDYCERFDELAEVPFELVEAEYCARIRCGDQPSHDEFARRFPHLSDQLSERLSVLDEAGGTVVGQTLIGEEAGTVDLPDSATRSQAEATIQESMPHDRVPVETAPGSETLSNAQSETVNPDRQDVSSEVTLVETPQTETSPDQAETMVESAEHAETIIQSSDTTAGGGSAAPTPGVLRKFGDYEVLSEIARGGMGVVYRARQVKLNRVVAVKMILQGQLASPADIQRFYSEAEAAARLEHSGIVPIYEVGEVDSQHYFSMGYVDGESLSDRVRQGPLPPREAAELVRDVADAIEYAHQNGVVHRDLKPGNILLTTEGQPKVTDFGLAKTIEQDSGLTASGQILGTPGYMPPEQASGQVHEVGPLADVYSLGAVLYCLLTGRPPFQSARVMETLKQVVETPPVSPRLLNPAVDRDLETVCLKCLEKEQSHRYPSAAELRDELQRYLSGEPIRSRPIGPFTRAWRWCRRKPLAAALVASIVVLTAGVFLTVQLAQSAAQTRALAAVQTDFEQTLDEATPTEEWLTRAESIAEQLEELQRLHPEAAEDSSQSAAAQPRVYQAFAGMISHELRHPRMDTDRAARIQGLINTLASRVPDQRDDLQSQLDRRLTDWLIDFDLAVPFSNDSQTSVGVVDDVFLPDSVVQADQLLQTSSDQTSVVQQARALGVTVDQATSYYVMAPAQLTRVSCQDDVQFEATFAPDWESAHEIGLTLNAGENRGYDFVIRNLKSRSARDAKSASPRLPSMATVRKRDGKVVAEIRRNGVPLLRREIEITWIPSGALRLKAKRVRGDLEFQINSGSPIRYYDPFAISGETPGVFGLRWPAGVSVTALTAQHRPRSKATSELELADVLFDDGKFAEAADLYRREMNASSDDSVQQEARYKLGLCLVALKEAMEASSEFGRLLAASDGQWAALAGIQLWLLEIRQRDFKNADVVFELLESRFRFEELATLIPTDVRQEILSSYMQPFQSISNVLKFDENRVRNLERGAAVDRLLSHDGTGRFENQMELVRVYRYVADWDKALTGLERLLPWCESGRYRKPFMRQYCRVLRFAGRHDRALDELNTLIAGRAGTSEPPAGHELIGYLVDRARIHYGLGNSEAAESDARRAVELSLTVSGNGFDAHNNALATLMLGVLLDDRGQTQAAIDTWRDGFFACRSLLHGVVSAYNTSIVAVLALGSLSGELTADEGSQFMKLVTSKDSGGSLVTMASTLVTPQTVTETMRDMWRTERGREAARNFAFETIPLRPRITMPVLLLGYTYFRNKSFSGMLTEQQDELLWDFVNASHRNALELGKLKMPQLMQIALSWKGTTNFIGWGGVAPTLDADYRAPLAWVLGHRFLRLGKSEQARMFFQTAMRDAKPDSLTALVVARDLELYSQEKSRLRLASQLSDVSVDVLQGGKSVQTITSTPIEGANRAGSSSATENLLEPGEYVLKVNASDSDIRCDAVVGTQDNPEELRIRIPLASTATIEIRSHWRSDERIEALPGLVPRPASLPGMGRWQVVRNGLDGQVRTVSWSPDSSLVAAGVGDGSIHLYDVDSGALLRVLNAGKSSPRAIEWSVDGRNVAVVHDDGEAYIWDISSGRLRSRLSSSSVSINSVAFHPHEETVAVSLIGNSELRYQRVDGTLLERFSPGFDMQKLAWSPDGRQLAVVSRIRGKVAIWKPRLMSTQAEWNSAPITGGDREISLSLPIVKKPPIEFPQDSLVAWVQVAWSPSGKFLATGSPDRLTVWDVDHRVVHRSWKTSATLPLQWSADSRKIWSTGWGQGVGSFDVAASEKEAPIPVSRPQPGGWVSTSPDLQSFAIAGHTSLKISRHDGKLLQTMKGTGQLIINALDWSPDSRRLAVGMTKCVALLDITIDPSTGQRVGSLNSMIFRPSTVASLKWAPNGDVLACCDHGGKVILISSEGETVAEVDAAGSLQDLDWHPDGSHLIVAGYNGTLRKITVKGQVTDLLPEGSEPLLAVSISPNGRQVAATGERTTPLRIWNYSDGTFSETGSVKLPDKGTALRWSPDGQQIAVASNRLYVVRVGDGTLSAGERQSDREHWMNSVDWLTDSKGLLAVTNGGLVLRGKDFTQKMDVLRQSPGRMKSGSLSRDGRVFATGTEFGSIELFDAQNGGLLGVILFPEVGSCVSLSSTGQPLAESRLEPGHPIRSGILYDKQVAVDSPLPCSDLSWLVESSSGEQLLLTRAEFFARLRSLRRRSARASKLVPSSEPEPAVLESIGRISDSSILEASGLVRSRRFPDVFWTISDSGNPAHLYAINSTGRVLARYAITSARNNDWETLALDKSGRLRIGDTGNLGNHRRRTIYELVEPDPRRAGVDSTKADNTGSHIPIKQLSLERVLQFQPDHADDDFEASFTANGVTYLIGKTQSGSAPLFRLIESDAQAASVPRDSRSTADKGLLQKVTQLRELPWVTGAAVSPDDHLLAVVTYTEVLLFDIPADAAFPQEMRPIRRVPFEAPLIESVSFDHSGRLVLLSEDGSLSRLKHSLPTGDLGGAARSN